MKNSISSSWSKLALIKSVMLISLVGCGGSGNDSPVENNSSTLSSFNLISLRASGSDTRSLTLDWSSASENSDITYSVCEKNLEMNNNCNTLATVTDSLTATINLDSLIKAVAAEFFILASNSSGDVILSDEKQVDSSTITELIGYFKASNTEEDDAFGFSIALSGDGSTLAVASTDEDNSATGIITDGSESTDIGTASNSGAVYMFRKQNNIWAQVAYLKASNAESDDLFGYSLSLNSDGSLLAVGAPAEDNGATGVITNGSESTDTGLAIESGAVYLFSLNAQTWSQSAYIKASNTDHFDQFGRNIALSRDGTTLAVSALAEDNAASGVITDGSETSDSGTESASGAVYLFNYSAGHWAQTAYVKASNTGSNDLFGQSIALSDDGETLAIGAPSEDNGLSGLVTDGSETTDTGSASGSGAAYLFSKASGAWLQTVYIKASNAESADYFARVVALSGDGTMLAVSSIDEDNGATGVYTDGSETTDIGLKPESGAVYLFGNSSGNWEQTAYLKASNASSSDYFGGGIAFNANGTLLAVGAYGEDNNVTGIIADGSEVIDSGTLTNSGAVYLFSHDGESWNQTSYIKASNSGIGDFFGSSNLALSRSLALSADGLTLAVGSQNEDNGARGIVNNGSESSDTGTANNSGAVYLF